MNAIEASATMPATTAPPLISVENLQTFFYTDDGVVKAVNDVSFQIPRGKVLGLVGESGCGKSVTAMSIIRLISPPGKIAGGRITMHDDGQTIDLTALSERRMRKIRGAKISMIFQEPMSSLNPVFTIGAQIAEAVRLHRDVTRKEAWDLAVEMLVRVKIPEPAKRARAYPHEFSGGMRQRAMIAMALSCNPKLLIADEPTTALDVTIQAQILDLLRELQQDLGMSILMITHDLGIIAETADEVAVMYASRVVEQAPVAELFSSPRHPYTHGLFESIPRPGMSKDVRLATIEGMVPSPLRFPAGCKFHPRCRYDDGTRCREEEPELRVLSPDHAARCHYADTIEYGDE